MIVHMLVYILFTMRQKHSVVIEQICIKYVLRPNHMQYKWLELELLFLRATARSAANEQRIMQCAKVI